MFWNANKTKSLCNYTFPTINLVNCIAITRLPC